MIEDVEDEIILSKKHVLHRIEQLKEYLKDAEKEVEDKKSELRRSESARDNIKREIGVWEKTIAAFKEAGISL